MISYSERDLFPEHERRVLHQAQTLIARIPDTFHDVRCHELARAAGLLLDLPYQDGSYGFVDHTWLWTRPLQRTLGRMGFPDILDVYAVGQLPMVRLVACDNVGLPHVGWAYRPGAERDDIDGARVHDLVMAMRVGGAP
jgi:hypothetical protein